MIGGVTSLLGIKMSEAELLIPAVARSLERIFDVLLAGMTIWLGYKLYNKAGTELSNLEASSSSWLFKLKNVGPGTLFALFGCLVIIYSLVNPVSVGNSPGEAPPATGEKLSKASWQYYGFTDMSSAPPSTQLKIISAITVVSHFADLKRYPTTEAEINDFNVAIEDLREERHSLVTSYYSPEAMNRWNSWHTQEIRNPSFLSGLSQPERRLYENISEALDVH